MKKTLLWVLPFMTFAAACGPKPGEVSTFAGSGIAGAADGRGQAASFSNPMGIAADSAGNLYVADSRNNLIRKITPDGDVTTIAGNGKQGSADGKGAAASVFFPAAVTADAHGNVYVADTHNNLVRKISPNGIVTTLAGRVSEEVAKYKDTVVKLDGPYGVAVDKAGNVYVSDWERDMIKKITPDGKMTAFAGSGQKGNKDGKGATAGFYLPEGLAIDNAGNLYVADCFNNMIRKITPDGTVTTLAGNVKKGSADGSGKAASFNHPDGLAVDAAGNVYVADVGNNKIRKISPAGVVTTLAGTGKRGNQDGALTQASFWRPLSVAISKKDLYVADYQNNVIRKIKI